MSNFDQLEIIHPDGKVTFYDLPIGEVTNIGQHPDNQIVLSDTVPFLAVLDHRQKPYQLMAFAPTQENHTLYNGSKLLLRGYTLILLMEEGESVPDSSVRNPQRSGVTTDHNLPSPISPIPSLIDPSSSPQDQPDHKFTIGELNPKQQRLSKWGQSAQVWLPLTNQSECQSSLLLSASDEFCHFEFELPQARLAQRAEIQLSAGESIQIPIHITPPERPILGLSNLTYRYIITVSIPEVPFSSRSVGGQISCSPLIGSWLMSLIVLCLITVLGFALYGYLLEWHMNRGQGQIIPTQMVEDYPNLEGIPIPTLPPLEVVSKLDLTYEEIFQDVAQRYELDWKLLAALAYRESGMNPNAIGRDHDMGLMQIIPSTWHKWAAEVDVTNPYNPHSNVLVAGAYLAYIRDFSRSRGYNDTYWILIGYNWGPHNLKKIFNSRGSINDVPAKQRQYAFDILRDSTQPAPLWRKHIPEDITRIEIQETNPQPE